MSTLRVEQIARGLWRWTAAPSPCPQGDVVSTYAEVDGAIVLVDPVVPHLGTAEHLRFFRALDGDVERLDARVVVLATCPEHARDVPLVLARYRDSAGAPSSTDALPASIQVVADSSGELTIHLQSHATLVIGHAACLKPQDGVTRVLAAHEQASSAHP